jgi:hypothetical protein
MYDSRTVNRWNTLSWSECEGRTVEEGRTPHSQKLSIIEDEGFNRDRQKSLEKSTLQLKNPYNSKYICVKHFPPPYNR